MYIHREIANLLKNRRKSWKIAFRPKGVWQSDFPHSRRTVEFPSWRGSGRATRVPAHYRLGHAQAQPVEGCRASSMAASPSTYALYRRPTVKKIGNPDTFWPKSDVPRFSLVFQGVLRFLYGASPGATGLTRPSRPVVGSATSGVAASPSKVVYSKPPVSSFPSPAPAPPHALPSPWLPRAIRRAVPMSRWSPDGTHPSPLH